MGGVFIASPTSEVRMAPEHDSEPPTTAESAINISLADRKGCYGVILKTTPHSKLAARVPTPPSKVSLRDRRFHNFALFVRHSGSKIVMAIFANEQARTLANI